jgi:RimJ/RimL family protein N-acetyltransferase
MTDLSNWQPCSLPGLVPLEGQRVRLEPLEWDRHGPGLFAATGGEANADIWTWMPVGPFPTPDSLGGFLAGAARTEGWRTMIIVPKAASEIPAPEVLGMAAYMRIREAHGSAEIGCVAFGPKLKRTAEATEALALMARHLFVDLGYRRYEWKCNFENLASKRAAERFGFVFEGVFRNDMVTKGCSRDTAWYSITGAEWPALDAALAHWLSNDNFAKDGTQIRTLESFRGT